MLINRTRDNFLSFDELQQDFKLKRPTDIKNFFVDKRVRGLKAVSSYLFTLAHRIIHYVQHRVWINIANTTQLIEKKYQRAFQEKFKEISVPNADKIHRLHLLIKVTSWIDLFENTEMEAEVSKLFKEEEIRKLVGSDPINPINSVFVSTPTPPQSTQIQAGLVSLYKTEFECLVQATKQQAKLTAEDIAQMQLKWDTFIATGKVKTPTARLKLFSFLLKEINSENLKRNFASLQAEKELNDPRLKEFQGGEKKLSGPYFLQLLKKNSSALGLDLLADHLSQRLEDYQLRYFAYGDSAEAEDLRKEEAKAHFEQIHTLPLGHDYIFLANWYYTSGGAHALSYIFTRQLDGKFSIKIVNSGDGISKHQRKRVFTGKMEKAKFKPYYLIKNISPEKINEAFLLDLVKLTQGEKKIKNTDEFYKEIVEKLDGTVDKSPIMNKAKELITPQRTGSCFSSCWLALFRTCTSFESYKLLIYKMKTQSIIQFYDRMKNNFAHDESARLLMEIALKKQIGNEKCPSRLDKLVQAVGKHKAETALTHAEKQQLDEVIKAVAAWPKK